MASKMFGRFVLASLCFNIGCVPSADSVIEEQRDTLSLQQTSAQEEDISPNEAIRALVKSTKIQTDGANNVPVSSRCSIDIRNPSYFSGSTYAVGWAWCESDGEPVTGVISLRREDGSLVDEQVITQWVGRTPVPWLAGKPGCRDTIKYLDMFKVNGVSIYGSARGCSYTAP